MTSVIFLTHPDVIIDPLIPVTQWALSTKGIAKLQLAITASVFSNVTSIFSSTERKAVQTAEIITKHLGLTVDFIPDLGEINRSSTGYLEVEKYQQMTQAFFMNPEESVHGWERAIDAQNRIVNGVKSILERIQSGEVLIVSHGGVGALLLAFILDKPIHQHFDQPSQGYYFTFTREFDLEHSWRSLDEKR